MRSDRESLLSGLVGFLTGILFTLTVLEFAATAGDKLERRMILIFMLILAGVLFSLYWLRSERGRSSNGSRTLSGTDWEGPPESPRPEASSGIKRSQEESPRSSVKEPPAASPRTVSAEAQRASSSTSTASRKDFAEAEPRLAAQDDYSYSPTGDVDFKAGKSPVGAERLTEVWETYFRKGDGKFNSKGLQRQLEAAGISAEVIPGERLNEGDSLLAIDFRDGSGLLYVLPNFGKTLRSVENWFQAVGTGSRLARIQRLLRPATALRKGGNIVVDRKGEVA